MVIGILEQRADPASRGAVSDAADEVKEMSSLVNELLSFSKAGLKPRDVEGQPVDLGELAARIVEREGGAGRVQVAVPAGLVALAEPELLGRALANLVRNALRYAGDAGPITVSAERTGGDILLRVTDSGPGVPDDALSRIFDPFYRVEASRSRETGGVGLGLAIVKTCVEACRGRVIARNRQPCGLEVTLQLPAAV
jgi:two-component system sensor histidine kinase CpxA